MAFSDIKINPNLTMLMDFYELTMANGYFSNNFKNQIVYFDMFFRTVPDSGGFAIMSGLEQVIKYIENFKFSKEDIEYLRSKKIFKKEFLDYLKNFNFSCDIWSVPEGSVVFPGEPILTVRGPVIQAQLIETMILICINHQSLIATKANRIVRAAKGRTVLEFGARRAQGSSAAIYGSRSAFIAGCDATSCTISNQLFDIPVAGTMAHSWVQLFDTELDAFRAYAKQYPSDCIILVDTYNTLKSGIPNAIKVFKEEILPRGFRPIGIRIDSGDITYLSKKARQMLDDAGFPDCKICVSNSLDEYIIRDMVSQKAQVDIFGVGENIITASSQPVFGGVYKLCAIEDQGKIMPKIKISENVSKINIPCFKEIFRIYDKNSNKAICDIITLNNELIDDTRPCEIFDPIHIWKRKTINNFIFKKIRCQIFKNGKICYKSPGINEIRNFCKGEVEHLWEEVTRFENPHKYYVDLSQKLWDIKSKCIKETCVDSVKLK